MMPTVSGVCGGRHVDDGHVDHALERTAGVDQLRLAAGAGQGEVLALEVGPLVAEEGVDDTNHRLFADERVAATGLGRVEVLAPFTPTLPGTQTYVDELRE